MRAIDAGKSSLYNAELAEMSLTRALSHKHKDTGKCQDRHSIVAGKRKTKIFP
jgi:hypothetical protein